MGVRRAIHGLEDLDTNFNQLVAAARNQPLKVLPFVFLTTSLGDRSFTFMLWDFLRMEELANGKTKIYTSDGKTATVLEGHDDVVLAMQAAAELFAAVE